MIKNTTLKKAGLSAIGLLGLLSISLTTPTDQMPGNLAREAAMSKSHMQGRMVEKMSDSTRQKLDSLVKNQAKAGQCRITMKVTIPNGESHYFGYDGREDKTIDDFSQPVEIGSCSKMFTATSILQLVERKEISLDDNLSDLLDQPQLLKGLMATDSADYLQEVRLKNLLNHTSGLPEYFVDDDEMELAIHGDSTLRFTPEQLVRMAKRLNEPQFRPGEKFKYTNTNYILLGMILEQQTGRSYQDYIKRNLLSKAGLEHTFFPSIEYIPGRAPGYWNQSPSEMPATLAGPAGEIVSTLDDMDRFIRAWARGEFFTSQQTMELLRSEYFNPMGGGLSYGLGVINLFSTLGHGGQTFGFQSYMDSLPNGASFVFAIDDAAIPAWGLAMSVQGALRKMK